MRLPAIFSSGALYLQKAPLKLHGETAPDSAVTLMLRRGEELITSVEVKTDSKGAFEAVLPGQKASFDSYSISVVCGEDRCDIEDVLFGELWLASGQSNMEMPNHFMNNRAEIREECRSRKLRFFSQNHLPEGGVKGPFPFDPVDTQPGKWITAEDEGGFNGISACATTAVIGMYDHLNKKADVPVGFVNCNMGSTAIETWLPKESIMKNRAIYAFMKAKDRLPTTEKWDSYGDNNYVQPCALYNLNVSALIGISFRGVLWYQGESNVGNRACHAHYINCMKEYSKIYSALFSPDGKPIPMVCSQLYPWLYEGAKTECAMGYVNESFSVAAQTMPDLFASVSIYDLPPVWAMTLNNHPIHPANKYAVGERLGMAANAIAYKAKGLRSSVPYKSCRRKGNALLVKMDVPAGMTLECKGDTLRGFWLAGADELYLKADAKIISNDTVELTNPYIAEPVHGAYQYAQLQRDGNLWCGKLPAAPFATDRKGTVKIAPTPWTDFRNDIWWIQDDISVWERLDSFNRPLWQGMDDCEICRDDVFTVTGNALRIRGRKNQIGAYVRSYRSLPIEPGKYQALTLAVFGKPDAVKCAIYQPQQNGVIRRTELTAALTGAVNFDFDAYRIDLSGIEDLPASRIELIFESSRGIKAVNIDDLKLIPKGYKE
ncbi:MAG: hypothetical protein J6I45_07160 [Clostridia bacterium]|nr:hypothetical protein [Clostridia bacterium]